MEIELNQGQKLYLAEKLVRAQSLLEELRRAVCDCHVNGAPPNHKYHSVFDSLHQTFCYGGQFPSDALGSDGSLDFMILLEKVFETNAEYHF